MVNQLLHTNWKLVQNSKYQTHVFYFFPFVVQKETAHVDTKSLNVRHQSQNYFWGIFVEIPQHHKGYLIYVPSTHKIVSLHDIVFDKKKVT